MDILIWILVWIVGTIICLGGYYSLCKKITLSYLVYSLLLWWIIVPFCAICILTGTMITCLEKMDDIVLFKKK